MKIRLLGYRFLTLCLTAALIQSTAHAVDFALDPADTSNGLADIYSATFDPPLDPGCPVGTLTAAECAFFNGQTPATRAIVVNPTPTGTEAVADTTLCVQQFNPSMPGPPNVPPCPVGTLYATATPSALDLTLSAGNTMLEINGGDVFLPSLTLVINGGTASQTDVAAEGASFITLAPSGGAVPIDGSGVAVFQVDIAPSTAADFSTFTEIVTSCTGSLCSLIPILTLDMQRYQLTIDWDPTFSSFTADFKGQTANNSIVFATLNSAAPEITVTDSVAPTGDLTVPFGNVIQGMTSDQTVTVTNDGNGNLTIGTLTAPAAPFSLQADNCSGQVIAPAAMCTVTVRFAPVSVAVSNSSFDIPSDDGDENPVTVTLSGTGAPIPVPDITVTDNVAPTNDQDVPFGSVQVASTSDQTVTVTNDGTADLTIGNIAAANPLAAPFSILNDTCSSAVLNPAAGCTFDVRFAPTAATPSNDSFDIPSDDPDEDPVTVTVDGTGSAIPVPDITVTDSVAPAADLQVPFGNVTEMTTADQTVTVTNDGNANLTLLALVAPAAPFSILNDTCSSFVVIPTDNCTFDVHFAPTTTGMFNSSVAIPSDDPDENPVTVNISGTGAPTPTPDITVTDSVAPINDLQVPFGNIQAATTSDQTVTITNDGNATLTIGDIVAGSMLGAPFSILNDNCSNQVVNPAANCTLTVRFAPTAAVMSSDSFDIPSDDPDENLVAVAVNGTGTAAAGPDITVNDTIPPFDDLDMDFGDVTEMTAWVRTITIRNDGTAGLQVGMIAQANVLAGPFSISADNCSAQTVAPAATCTIDVQFMPGSVDVFNDSFDIPSNDVDEASLTFSVGGTGVVLGTGTISLAPEGSDSGLFGTALRPLTLLALLMLIAANVRRRIRV